MENEPRRGMDQDQRRMLVVLAVMVIVIVVLAIVIGTLIASLGAPVWLAVVIGVGVAATLGLFFFVNLI